MGLAITSLLSSRISEKLSTHPLAGSFAQFPKTESTRSEFPKVVAGAHLGSAMLEQRYETPESDSPT